MLADMAATPALTPSPAPQPGVLLHAAVDRMRRRTGVAVAFGGQVSPGGGGVRLAQLSGARTDALSGLFVGAGHGLGGRVLLTARPGSVDDYAADARISHEYDRPVIAEGLRSIAAVPVLADGAVCALLYGGIREPLPLGTRVLDAMNQVAARVGVEWAVRAEVQRRLVELETAALTRAARETPSAPAWERVREAHAELRSIAGAVADPALRRRLEAVCAQLTGAGAGGTGHGDSGDGGGTGGGVRLNPLSARELDVLALVAVGCANGETARRLGLRPETVKSYLRSVMRKLGTHNRAESVVAARRAGFLP